MSNDKTTSKVSTANEVIARPLPDPTARMQPFHEGAAEGCLRIQRCRDCGLHHFPAIEVCNGCLGSSLDWITASGRGVLFSFVRMHQVYHPAFADLTPYVIADVKLDEGPRIISTVIGCEAADLKIDMPLAVEFQSFDDENTPSMRLPVFKPAD